MVDEEKFKKQFAKRLKELRKLANLTQAEFAEKVGFAEKTISYWENAHNTVAITTLPLIAEVLNVPVYSLFVFDEDIKITDFGPLTDRDKQIAEKIIKLYLSK